MNPEEQVIYLKQCIKDLIDAYRRPASLEDWFQALWNAEQALNIHDCQDPAVGCSCYGSVGFPSTAPPVKP